ncbi:hypothetical protein DICPUDRAFT_96735 [Dictyostelium purpureum]|uniref:Protein transport protein SEC23 n=1 Tax=Dictyostelium purpureum TaxID=5786 RepID=F0ZAT5_DICPU|nr:uncharacterized protein DICPUDRAFT_96735 [Dictyostelium purpureum]EGC38976.1 hypothetical protein DICPUDRAFT_96735 [Dictyostelium purpureum]|eukprot:XP_003284541.1 hypothetical protein DICPUDRAFT_96735 [Dictyostelium purpureum]
MNVKFSTQRFPTNQYVKDGTNSIWGCVVQPLKNTSIQCHENSKNIGRCSKCNAYINSLVVFERVGWVCNLCQTLNPIDYDIGRDGTRSRYATPDRNNLPELSNTSYELFVENNFNNNTTADRNNQVVDGSNEINNLPDSIPYSIIPLIDNPIYIAVVDYSGSKEQDEVITSGLEALVHALPDNALFGLIVFSKKIGIYNLNTSTPLIKFIDSIDQVDDFNFDDIIPLEKFLVNKGKFESNIIRAIHSISQINETVSKKMVPHALSQTIDLLLDYITIEQFKPNVKIGLFLTQYAGEFKLKKGFSSIQDLVNNYGKSEFLKPATNVYRKQSERAVELGAHFDIFAIGDRYFGFDSIKFLCTNTGGQLYRYDKLLPTCSLPQDIFKLVSTSWGFHGLLRVRSSKQFSIDQVYGSILQSQKFENLYHIESCSPFTSVGFEFKFNSLTSRFSPDELPNLQIAFSYSYLPSIEQINQNSPTLGGSGAILGNSGSFMNNNDSNSKTRKIEKRLHIFNISLPISNTAEDLFSSIDLETTISLITQKVIRNSLENGITKAGLMLKQWLHDIFYSYNENVVILSKVTSQVDINFSQMTHLRPLPRYIFALLKSPILRKFTVDLEETIIKKKSDEWIYHQCLFSSLEPRLLHRALYPVLYSYGAPNNLASKYLPLSINTILTSTSNIYLVDSFDSLVVFYNLQPESPQQTQQQLQHQFPPPPESLIRQTISSSKQDRLIVPEIKYLKGKLNETPEFLKYLIEEETNAGEPYYQFLNEIGKQIHENLTS